MIQQKRERERERERQRRKYVLILTCLKYYLERCKNCKMKNVENFKIAKICLNLSTFEINKITREFFNNRKNKKDSFKIGHSKSVLSRYRTTFCVIMLHNGQFIILMFKRFWVRTPKTAICCFAHVKIKKLKTQIQGECSVHITMSKSRQNNNRDYHCNESGYMF